MYNRALEVLVVKTLLDTCLGRHFGHLVVFLGRPLHVIHGRIPRSIKARHHHLRQTDVFRPGDGRSQAQTALGCMSALIWWMVVVGVSLIFEADLGNCG